MHWQARKEYEQQLMLNKMDQEKELKSLKLQQKHLPQQIKDAASATQTAKEETKKACGKAAARASAVRLQERRPALQQRVVRGCQTVLTAIPLPTPLPMPLATTPSADGV